MGIVSGLRKQRQVHRGLGALVRRQRCLRSSHVGAHPARTAAVQQHVVVSAVAKATREYARHNGDTDLGHTVGGARETMLLMRALCGRIDELLHFRGELLLGDRLGAEELLQRLAALLDAPGAHHARDVDDAAARLHDRHEDIAGREGTEVVSAKRHLRLQVNCEVD